MRDIDPPYPAKQIQFHQLLVAARTTILHGALADALGEVDPQVVGRELDANAPTSARRMLARAGVRDEHVFATPAVLRARPTTLGYYRLLLGVSKKQFYRAEIGLSRFSVMEEQDRLRQEEDARLPDLCSRLNAMMAELVMQLAPDMSPADVDQLPLLTLGAQFDGGYRNGLGQAAVENVSLAIRELVVDHIQSETANSLTLVNNSGRTVGIVFGADPDVAITEEFNGDRRLNVAVEIKGGTDRSNAHNRAGEAEKSHQKVRNEARDFWTLIAMRGVDQRQLARESPTTRKWYDVAQVLARTGPDWDRFRNDVDGAIGI